MEIDAEIATAVEGEVQAPADDVAVSDGQGDELAAIRELVLRAHPDAVPELISGTTLAELLASVPVAEAAYARIVATVQEATPVVPGGGGVRSATIDVDGLGPLAKIRAGLRHS